MRFRDLFIIRQRLNRSDPAESITKSQIRDGGSLKRQERLISAFNVHFE